MAGTATHRTADFGSRLVRAARTLTPERRLAAIASVGLFVALFLPWYQETFVSKALKTASESLTGWSAFSWVEAAVLLVAAGVLTLLYQRAEGRAFHVPGGDGGVILAAGGWTSVLVVWRIFDKQGVSSHGLVAANSGVEWGIFVALAMAILLAYSGTRIRAAHQPEPALPGDDERAYRSRRRERTAARTSARSARQPAGAAEGPLRRLFDESHPAMFERPTWTAPTNIKVFEPDEPRTSTDLRDDHGEVDTDHTDHQNSSQDHRSGLDDVTKDTDQQA